MCAEVCFHQVPELFYTRNASAYYLHYALSKPHTRMMLDNTLVKASMFLCFVLVTLKIVKDDCIDVKLGFALNVCQV